MRKSTGGGLVRTVNVTDANNTGIPTNVLIDPSVAIPVEDLNISEPPEGYPSLEYQHLFSMKKITLQ